MSQLYRKKPILVRAFLWNGAVTCDGIPVGTIHSVHDSLSGKVSGVIETSEGPVNIREGDHYIVGPGHSGEFWPVERVTFEATYERVTT